VYARHGELEFKFRYTCTQFSIYFLLHIIK
jgi:hypothetical protein